MRGRAGQTRRTDRTVSLPGLGREAGWATGAGPGGGLGCPPTGRHGACALGRSRRPRVSRTRLRARPPRLRAGSSQAPRRLRGPQREVTALDSSPGGASPRVQPGSRDPPLSSRPARPPSGSRSPPASQAPPSPPGSPPHLHRGPLGDPWATLSRGNLWVDPGRRQSSEGWTRCPSILRGRNAQNFKDFLEMALSDLFEIKVPLSRAPPPPVGLTGYACCVLCVMERIFAPSVLAVVRRQVAIP